MAVRIPIKTEGGSQAVDDLKKVGDAGQAALDRINRASKEPSAGLKTLNGVTSELKNGLDDLGGRAGVVGRIISNLGPVGLAAGAALGTFTAGLSLAVAEADKAERARLKIEALLRTTQSASGQTYESIAALADQIALSTMATGDQVEAAAAILLTFKSVAGDAFGRTLKVAQDMAAVMGGDMTSSITQLGKALEDPERGLSALSRSGITFNETQIETIKYMVEMGDKSRALGEILKILEGQIGGAGEADAGTLSGAFHKLTERVGMFFEKIGQNSGLLEGFTDIVNTMSKGMGNIDSAIFKDAETQAAEKFQELLEARARLDELLNSKTMSGQTPQLSIDRTRERIAALETELKALTDKRQAEAAAAVAAQQAAQAARIAATEEAVAAGLREKSEKRMDDLQKDRDARLKKDAADQKRIAEQQAAARKSIDAQIDSLENEQTALALSERERAIFIELLKAEETARKAGIAVTNEQRESIIRETGALFDQKKAIEDRKKADEESARAAEKAQRERERIAEREAEALMKPFEHAAEGVQDTLTDSIEKGLHGSLDTAADVFEQLKNIAIRAASEVASAWIIRPAIAGTGLFGGGTATAGTPGGGGFSMPTSGISNLAQLGGGYGGAFLGAAGGAFMGYQQGGVRGAAIGGLAGYAGGAAMTSGAAALAAGWGGAASGGAALAGASSALAAIPVWGWAALAALAVFGSGKKAPSNASAYGVLDITAGRQLQAPAERNSTEETRGARDAIVQAVMALREGLVSSTGGTVSGIVGLDVGRRDGVQVSGLGAGRYADPQSAVAGIFRAMTENLQGVDDQFRAVFARLDLSNLDQAVADLGTAAAIINKSYVESEPLNAAAQAIKNINSAFDALIVDANRLGINAIPILHEKYVQLTKLSTDFTAEIEREILAFTDPLAAALADFDKAAAERLDNAITVGADLVAVEKLTALERARIVEQYGQQANSALLSANQSIEQFLTGLRSGSGSFLSPQATLANAEAEFQRLLGLAQGGDVSARGALTGAAGNLIEASREVFGSSEMFFQRLGFVEQTLGNLVGKSSGTTVYDNLGMTIAAGNATTEYQLSLVVAELQALRATVAEQQAALDRLAAA